MNTHAKVHQPARVVLETFHETLGDQYRTMGLEGPNLHMLLCIKKFQKIHHERDVEKRVHVHVDCSSVEISKSV